jgi:hypothetical protein
MIAPHALIPSAEEAVLLGVVGPMTQSVGNHFGNQRREIGRICLVFTDGQLQPSSPSRTAPVAQNDSRYVEGQVYASGWGFKSPSDTARDQVDRLSDPWWCKILACRLGNPGVCWNRNRHFATRRNDRRLLGSCLPWFALLGLASSTYGRCRRRPAVSGGISSSPACSPTTFRHAHRRPGAVGTQPTPS